MKNWLKTTVLSLLLAASFACNGQSVITQYIYEVQVYTNVIHEISNNVWTVSNITIRTQNEITQNVNRVYNYSTTNLYFNIITNNYVDTVVGTNIEVNIATNYDYNTNIYTNYWITNHVSETKKTYLTTIHTNLHQDVFVTYETNYVSEVTLTNFEGYVQQCENIISNGIDTISEMTNTVGDAMLYAYICNEAAQRLASTNAIVFATNSIPMIDKNGYYDRLFQLACNNLNGSFMGISAGTEGYNIYATSVYAVSIVDGTTMNVKLLYLSHVTQNSYGMEVVYLPRDNSSFVIGTSRYLPAKMTWRYGCASNVLTVLRFDNNGNYTGRYEASNEQILFPTARGMDAYDGSYSFLYRWTQMKQYTTGNPTVYYKTSSSNPHSDRIFAPMFPSLNDWKYMWWVVNTTGEYMR